MSQEDAGLWVLARDRFLRTHFIQHFSAFSEAAGRLLSMQSSVGQLKAWQAQSERRGELHLTWKGELERNRLSEATSQGRGSVEPFPA